MQNCNNSGFSHFISPMLAIPSSHRPENKFNSLTMFTLPKSLLDKKIQFFISMKNLKDGFAPFPNVVAGSTGRVDD